MVLRKTFPQTGETERMSSYPNIIFLYQVCILYLSHTWIGVLHNCDFSCDDLHLWAINTWDSYKNNLGMLLMCSFVPHRIFLSASSLLDIHKESAECQVCRTTPQVLANDSSSPVFFLPWQQESCGLSCCLSLCICFVFVISCWGFMLLFSIMFMAISLLCNLSFILFVSSLSMNGNSRIETGWVEIFLKINNK